MSSNPASYAQKRRSSRIQKAIPVAVQGVDPSHAPYREEVTTGIISCHGCTYRMKREVFPGDLVVLHVGHPSKGSEYSRRARVKWIQKQNTIDRPYDVGVEFEVAGNIWGITSPPADWIPAQPVKRVEGVQPGRELRLVARTDQQTALARNAEATPAAPVRRAQAPTPRAPWFSDLMAALSNQVQITVSEIAAVTLANERNRLLEAFRAEIQKEAAVTIERVIVTANEELARRGLKVLSEAAEATVRTSHERLVGAIEQNVKNARERMLSEENVLSQRVAGIATNTLERLQRTFEVSRNEQTDRFVSGLKERVAPVIQEANEDLQKLAASQTAIKEESQAICARVANQLESNANATVMQTHNALGKSSTAVLKETNEKLRELSESLAKFAHDNGQTILASATEDAKKNLEERATEISGHFTDQLEGHVRDYLEFIGQTIADFPKKEAPEE